MKYICLTCKTPMSPKSVTPGSLIFELILWCCMLLPGFIYSMWRMCSRKRQCPHCASQNFVKVTSAPGQRLLAEVKVAS